MYSFGFIGCGNMGGTLASAVSKNDKNIAVSDKNKNAVLLVSENTGAAAVSNEEIAANSKYIVLGVKPQILPLVLDEIAPTVRARTDEFAVISMAAGVKIEKITDALGNVPVIRIMPNTPAVIGEGMIVYSYNGLVTDGNKAEFLKAFSAAGELCEIKESLIDAACAVSGCGPAFVYMFIEALADGGVKCGLSRDLSLKLAAKTVSGAADTVILTGKHPEALKDAVCSPAGSTIEGVGALEKGAFRGTVSDAVTAAYKRTKELG